MSCCRYASFLQPFSELRLRRAALALLQGYNFLVLSATNHPDSTAGSHSSPMPEIAPGTVAGPTPLCAALGPSASSGLYCGTLTPRVFDGLPGEIDSLLHSAGVSDLGWRGKILVTGSDRLRWLNGMVSNAVQALPEGEGNYSLLLSVQGRIQ